MEYDGRKYGNDDCSLGEFRWRNRESRQLRVERDPERTLWSHRPHRGAEGSEGPRRQQHEVPEASRYSVS